MKNIFQNIPKDLPEELIEIISENKNVKIERIISRGHSSPKDFWYNQDTNEFVILLSGSAVITYKNKKSISMKKGDYLLIPAHQMHRVEETSKYENSIWLAIHY